MTRRIFNLLILDESGSMSAIERQAISGVNETVQTILSAQRNHPDQDHYVTLVSFNSEHFNLIYDNRKAAEVEPLSSRQYIPMGCTPLYDAMGKALTRLSKDVAENDVVLVTVITDGEENSSTEYSGAAIKSLVEKLRKRGWVFTYIGANQDVEAVASSVGIRNSMSFDASPEGTCEMFRRESSSRARFFSRIVSNFESSKSKEDLDKDYFD